MLALGSNINIEIIVVMIIKMIITSKIDCLADNIKHILTSINTMA